MGGEIHALFLDLAQAGQGEHLESAGVGQDRAVPGHELMQASHFAHNLVRRTEMQMVCIGQFHLAANIFQVFCTQCALDGALGANIHKDGGLYGTVGAGKLTPTGLSLGF